jgi:hypothetical protein
MDRMLGFVGAMALATGLAGASGCAIVPEYALLYSDVNSSAWHNPHHQDVELEPKRYELLGRVEASGEVRNYFGVIALGDNGIAQLYQSALDKLPGANMLVDVRVDHHTRRIFSFYIHRVTTLEGMAVRVHPPRDENAPESGKGADGARAGGD